MKKKLFLKLGSSHLIVQRDSRIYWFYNYRFLSNFKTHHSHIWSQKLGDTLCCQALQEEGVSLVLIWGTPLG